MTLAIALATLSSEVTSRTSASAEPPDARMASTTACAVRERHVGDHQVVAGAREFGGDAGADAAAGAGDEDAA